MHRLTNLVIITMISTEPPAGNRLYRYELVNNRLVNPKLLLSLPATPGPNYDGGKVVIGPDNNIRRYW
jgi:aldose sugar dehydrogenase